MSIFTNCGEYLPFQAPEPFCPPLPPTTPPVLIPTAPTRFIPFELEDPRPPTSNPGNPGTGFPGTGTASEFKYKCVISNSWCPPDSRDQFGNIVYYIVQRACRPCNGGIGLDGYPNPAIDAPGCVHNTIEACVASGCISDPPCPTGTPPQTGTPASTSNPQSLPPETGYNNVTVVTNNPQTNIEVNQNNNIQGSDLFNGQESVYQNLNVNSNTIYSNLLNSTQPNHLEATNTNINTLASEGQFAGYERFGSNNTLYDINRNFFRINRTQETTTTLLVPNSTRLDIFNTMVASEVKYALDIVGSNGAWSEITLQSLSLQKIGASLNPNFFNVLNNIVNSAGFKIPIENFLETIRRHLLTGRISEIDSNYYYQLYTGQSDRPITTYTPTVLEEIRRRAAINTVNNESTQASTERTEECNKRIIRRQRRLNRDINTRANTKLVNGTYINIPIYNQGLYVSSQASGMEFIENAPGDGYYLYVTVSGDVPGYFETIPLLYDNNVFSAVYTPPATRFDALSIMNEDPSINLFVTSTQNNEFTQYLNLDDNDDQIIYSAIFLKLNLSSVHGTPTTNPVVENVTANYKLLNDIEEIDEYCDSNGFAITRLNIDYRDPFFKYIKQTSSLSLQQLDVNFNSFGPNNQLANNPILTKNIPFGIIIVPVAGSRFNPFSGFSRIESLGSTVSRSLKITPSFDPFTNQVLQTPLQTKFINEEGTGGRVGLVEPIEERATTFRFRASSADSYINTFYSEGIYISSTQPVSSYGASYLVKDVIDYIIQTYPSNLVATASSITWYDVFRRVPASRLGELFYDSSQQFISSLANGFRGVTIRHVLNLGTQGVYQTLPDDERCVITLGT